MGGLVERQLMQAIGGITEPDVRVIMRVAQEELHVNQLERISTRTATASSPRAAPPPRICV